MSNTATSTHTATVAELYAAFGRGDVPFVPVEEDLWVHVWTFDEAGKVEAFRHIGDLAREEIPFKG